jgi:hypothetical protein
MRLLVPTWLLALALVAGSCGGDNGLKGSICSVYDCSYDTVSIRDVSATPGDVTTVQIDYTTGPVTETVPRAAVVVCDVSSFVKGQELPLSDARHVAPDGVDFPSLKEGSCTFDTDLVPGAAVSGRFHAVFTTEAGTERALFGEFAGTLEETNL